MSILDNLRRDLIELSSPEKAKASAWFFKTGKGQYGEGDVFLGVTMPELRKIAKKYVDLPIQSVERLLQSKEHEFRMTALVILVNKYKKADESLRRQIYELYLNNTDWINNWDLVDVSAEHIVGPWLENRNDKMKVLRGLAVSKSIWERRIAMLSTFNYIKNGDSKEALEVARLLIGDNHDLIQKAVGWMLREVGKRCSCQIEEEFLQKNYKMISRTTLRYAIEHFPEAMRKQYLAGEF